ncbi:MAG: hypothetical protein U0587_01670 [Candidatus Binatia bacterium]
MKCLRSTPQTAEVGLRDTLGVTLCHLPLHLSDAAMLRAKAVQALAGPCAEERYLGKRPWGENALQYEEEVALDLAVEAVGEGEPSVAWFARRRNETRTLIRRHWSLIQVIAKVLLERRFLDGEALRSIATEAGWQDCYSAYNFDPQTGVIGVQN